ncbi:MAG TPA: sigma-70 family RNA polymerase sigma factor [Armatimonadota bacterium]|jgi:RNA polymerase sigma-70 factor (ECF subfamily)
MPLLTDEQLEPFWPVIRRVCVRMLGNEQDAEDATQDTFARAITRLCQYRGDASPATWLCRIAQSVCLNRLKKDARNRAADSLDDPDRPDIPDAAPGPQAETERIVYLRQLLCAVYAEAEAHAPPWDRYDYLVFEAQFGGDKRSWPEVGAVLGMNPETAKYHYYNHVVPVLQRVGERF